MNASLSLKGNSVHTLMQNYPGCVFSRGLDMAVSKYRHSVFVERLGWELTGDEPGQERDQYDREDTIYVNAHSADGQICGCARLLPTTRPYLLQEQFPTLLGDVPAPMSPHVWELSRFAADIDRDTDAIGQGGIQPLLAAVVACALEQGAKHLIGVTYLSMERLFRRIGIQAHRAAGAQCIDGRMVVACWINLDEQTLKALKIQAEPN